MKQTDNRWRALWATGLAVAALGLAIALGPNVSERLKPVKTSVVSPQFSPPPTAPGAVWATPEEEIAVRFEQAKWMLHTRQFEYAATALQRLLKLAPTMPEAHVNMGFALLGQQRFAAARDFFETALVLRAEQTNAYYGLAVALEGLCDWSGAIGAMRAYLHLSQTHDRFARKARAALWEWQAARADEDARDAARCGDVDASIRPTSEPASEVPTSVAG